VIPVALLPLDVVVSGNCGCNRYRGLHCAGDFIINNPENYSWQV
jgi:hypothetical protein